MTQHSTPKPKYFAPGTTIGLFGGSFDPPHAGHRMVSLAALRGLGLDHVWWLVSPQNPLKTHAPKDMKQRLAACRQMAAHPKLYVSDEETRLGTQYAIDTVRQLKARHPGVGFIWLMGSDNFSTLHHWKDWQGLMREIRVAVYPRPGSTLKVANSQAGQFFSAYRKPANQAQDLKYQATPAWTVLEGVRSALSSSDLRQNDLRQTPNNKQH
jgi:nicotinate-nucleotide adenylyltransferase